MNSEPANHISISEILVKLHLLPAPLDASPFLFPSPFHPEHLPTLFIKRDTNEWYDTSLEKGGTLLDFVCEYLAFQKEASTQADAKRWIDNMVRMPDHLPLALQGNEKRHQREDAPLVFKKAGLIEHLGLIRYLEKQGIPLAVAQQHLKQVYVLHKKTRKHLFVLGFDNEDGGYELRNPFFKGCLRPKALSFIRGSVPGTATVHIFKSCWDFLSARTRNTAPFKSDSLVLNAYECLGQVYPYLQHYGYRTLYSWMDHDAAGKRATAYLSHSIRSIDGLHHKTMSPVFAPHRDVHTWHLAWLGNAEA